MQFLKSKRCVSLINCITKRTLTHHRGKYHCTAGLQFQKLEFNCFTTYKCFIFLVKSNLVKIQTSCTVILPPPYDECPLHNPFFVNSVYNILTSFCCDNVCFKDVHAQLYAFKRRSSNDSKSQIEQRKNVFVNLLSIDCCPPVFWVGALFKKEYLILLNGQIDLLSSKHSKNDAELSGNI